MSVVPIRHPKPEAECFIVLAGGLPTMCRTLEAAKAEARRLAELVPGSPVTVFKPAFEVRAERAFQERDLT